MKKFLLFLTLFLSAVGIATAETKTDVIKFDNLSFDKNTQVGTATYYAFNYTSPTSGATYSGWANSANTDKNKNIQITKYSRGDSFYVKKSGGKLKSIVIQFSSGTFSNSKYLLVYANTADYSDKVTTEEGILGDQVLKQESSPQNKTISIDLSSNSNNYTSFYITSKDGAKYISSITVEWEITGDPKTDPAITWTLDKTELAEGAAVPAKLGETNVLPTLSYANGATVTCKSSNESVATVANDGTVEIHAAGTTTITASTPADDATFQQASKSYVLTVTKRFVWSDTKAVLVKDVNALQPGDVIIIANQEAKMAMSTNNQKNYREQTSITFNSDKSEITSDFTSVLLLELEQYTETVDEKEVIYWGFKTVNYTGDNGYLGNTTQSNYLRVNTGNILEEYLGKIEITDNVATIKLKKGQNPNTESEPKVINLIQFNKSANRFSCYGAEQTDGEVYIYRLEGSTTITDEAPTCKTPVENGNTTLTANSTFSTNSTASEFVVKMNGVEINATVEKADDLVSVDMVGLPYVPGAVFTISPVVEGKELHPVTLGITIPTLPVVDLGAVTLKLYFDKDAYGSDYGSDATCDLDAWAYLPVVLKDAVSKEELAADDARRDLALTFKEFANSVAGTEIWGWYDENKDQVQWCKYNYLTNVPVDKTDPENPTADLSSIDLSTTNVKLTFTPVYSFNVANKFASLIPSATPGSLSAPARAPEGFTVQNVELTALPVLQAWGNTPDVSGVESVVVEGVDGAVEYYNMQGVRVEGELAPGMYIRRQGRSVSKVQIR